MSNKTYRLFVEKLGGTDPDTFVGAEGELFYDPEVGVLKKSDGQSVGGVPLAGGGGSVDSVNGQVGTVSLDASDVNAAEINHTHVLADISDAGTAAAADVADFATAAQGLLADTAIQPIDCGDIISHSTTEFATSAQGLLADSAVQPEDLANVASSGDYNELINLPVLGTAASADSTDFATASQGTLADTAVQPGDAEAVPSVSTNLGKALVAGVSGPEWNVVKQGRVVHVARTGNDTIADGSFSKPFYTIQAAINYMKAVAVSENSVAPSCGLTIALNPGQYTEDITINLDGTVVLQTLDICAMPSVVIDSHPTKVVGQMVITGTNTTRVRIRDFQIATKTALEGGVNTDVALTITNTQGRIYFENVTFTQSISNPAVNTVQVIGNFQRWIDFSRCNWNGKIYLGGTPTGTPTVLVSQNNNLDGQLVIDHSSYVVRVHDCQRMGAITHNAGRLFVKNVAEIKPVSGDCIISTAADSPSTNYLVLLDTNLQGVTNAFGVYGKINKTGNCQYILGDLNRDPSIDVLTGTRLNLTEVAEDIGTEFSPTNYSVSDSSIASHLSGLDTSLGLRARRVSVPASATDVGVVGDYAVDASYAYYCIATDTWVRQPVATW